MNSTVPLSSQPTGLVDVEVVREGLLEGGKVRACPQQHAEGHDTGTGVVVIDAACWEPLTCGRLVEPRHGLATGHPAGKRSRSSQAVRKSG